MSSISSLKVILPFSPHMASSNTTDLFLHLSIISILVALYSEYVFIKKIELSSPTKLYASLMCVNSWNNTALIYCSEQSLNLGLIYNVTSDSFFIQFINSSLFVCASIV